jgi:hypothetical protein
VPRLRYCSLKGEDAFPLGYFCSCHFGLTHALGKESTQQELIQNLASEFSEIERLQKIPAGSLENT